MKQLIVSLSLLSFFSCNNHKEHIADAAFTDSLIHHYSEPAVIKKNGAEICFWKKRINTNNPGIVNESKYAANLVSRFHLNGDIRDVKAADSILQKIDSLFNHKEAAPKLAMVKHCILQHRFTEASAYLQKLFQLVSNLTNCIPPNSMLILNWGIIAQLQPAWPPSAQKMTMDTSSGKANGNIITAIWMLQSMPCKKQLN
ncbi:MAG: hypothetical protein IPP72_18725 [Chitinophagaceae bacterium]|nr:hypothetical protein [Chitinophagaceae bacterium]